MIREEGGRQGRVAAAECWLDQRYTGTRFLHSLAHIHYTLYTDCTLTVGSN